MVYLTVKLSIINSNGKRPIIVQLNCTGLIILLVCVAQNSYYKIISVGRFNLKSNDTGLCNNSRKMVLSRDLTSLSLIYYDKIILETYNLYKKTFKLFQKISIISTVKFLPVFI